MKSKTAKVVKGLVAVGAGAGTYFVLREVVDKKFAAVPYLPSQINRPSTAVGLIGGGLATAIGALGYIKGVRKLKISKKSNKALYLLAFGVPLLAGGIYNVLTSVSIPSAPAEEGFVQVSAPGWENVGSPKATLSPMSMLGREGETMAVPNTYSTVGAPAGVYSVV